MYHHKYGMYHVSLIKAFIFQAWHVSYIIIYLLSMAYIIKAKYHHKQNINAKHHPTWTQKFLRGNPVTGDKTTTTSLTSKIYFTSNCWREKQPLTITLPVYCWKGQQPLLYNHFNGYNRKGLQPLHAYYVGPSTTLPP